MKKLFKILLIIFIYLLISISCEPEKNEAPQLTTFTLLSDNPTNLPFVNFYLEGNDDSGITGWIVKEDSTTPDVNDTSWLTNKPSFIRLNDGGNITLYAWAKDGNGNISNSLSLSLVYNQEPIVEDTKFWNKMINNQNGYDEGWTIKVEKNDNIYAVGYGTNLVSSSSYFDWWIKKFDVYGNEDESWNLKIDGGYNGYDMAYNLMIDNDENIFVIGYIGVTSTDSAWMIKKFDKNGNEDPNWNKTFNGGDDSESKKEDAAFDIAMDSENNIYIVGTGFNIYNSTSEIDWWIKKFDNSGNEITTGWNKGIDDGSTTGDEEPFGGVEIDSQDNIYVAGVGMDLIDSSSNQDWWIKKFDKNGNEITTGWDKRITSEAGSKMDRLFLLKVDNSDNVWVGGGGREVGGTGTSDDWWIKKFNSNGNELLQITADGNTAGDYVRSIVFTQTGNIFVLGYGINLVEATSGADWWIRKYDSEGNYANWEAKFKGNGIDEDLPTYMQADDYVYSLAIDSNGDIYAQGNGIELISEGSHYDWWIKKWAVSE